MHLDSATIGILGKVPWFDEYVRVRTEGQAFDSFDAWLTSNFAWATASASDGWREAYRKGGIHAFVFRPPGNAPCVLAGALGPSSDSAGRDYPLAIAAPVAQAASLCDTPEALPILLEDLWAFASELLLEARNPVKIDLAERLASASVKHDVDPATALSFYADWVRDLSVEELSLLVFGEADPKSVSDAIRLVLETIRPQRGVDRASTPLTLRLPLGTSGGAAVCFWIDLVKRAAHWKKTIPTFFWSHDGNRGFMLLHLGVPPKSTLVELWNPSSAHDAFCDISQPVRPEHLQNCRTLTDNLASHLVRDGKVSELLRAIEGEP